MKVFKFGGASVKDASSVKNVARILSAYKQDKLFVVISAMGKTTNALEAFTRALYHDLAQAEAHLKEIKDYHFQMLHELFDDPSHAVFTDLHIAFVELEWLLD